MSKQPYTRLPFSIRFTAEQSMPCKLRARRFALPLLLLLQTPLLAFTGIAAETTAPGVPTAAVPAQSTPPATTPAAASAPASSSAPAQPEEVGAAQLPLRIAALASPATVGVYCQKDGDRFYGTGVVVTGDGYILTSTTVVPEGAEGVEIFFSGHTKSPARIVEIAAPVESALLKVDCGPLAYLPLADDLPQVGAPAFTLGNAGNMIKLGDGASFSAGVISGLYPVRSIDSQSGYAGLGIETDAAVNDGQDGGPLLDAGGRVAGILSRSFSAARWQGVAVPALSIAAQLKTFAGGSVALRRTPLLRLRPGGEERTAATAATVARTLVALQVQRLYPPEAIRRQDWTEYRRSISDWNALSPEKRGRRTADFFAADNLLAANQMLRRPDAPATGVLISAQGHILTSAFNVQSSDLVYIPKDSDQPKLPDYEGDLAKLYGLPSEDYRKVANRVTRITAALPGGRTLPAEVLGFDLSLGIALLKVEATGDLPYLDLEQGGAKAVPGGAALLLGVAPGNPGYTVNTGIVSAAGRNAGNLLQFDALLNYGNSGGPLLDPAGNLLGIATAPINPAPMQGKLLPFRTPENDPGARALADFGNCPNSGVGMAASVEKIRASLPQMREGAGISRREGAILGFQPTAESAFAAKVVVGRVQENSPAARAELKVGDEIHTLDGIGVRSWQEILTFIKDKQPGDTVVFEVFRPLGKAYLLLNGQRIENAADFTRFLENAADNQNVTGNVYRPGLKQQIFLRLGGEK